MLTQQFLSAGLFYLVFTLFLFIGLPLTRSLFRSKLVAYVSAKFAGLILFGYFIWLLASFHILSNQNFIVITLLFFIIIATGLYLSRDFLSDGEPFNNKKTVRGRSTISKILILEGVTLLAYLGYLYLRAHNAEINGTERFMDLALINAAGKTSYFPFIDPWYAGHTVNYYYYGAYLMSMLGRLSHTPLTLAYNFALALIFTQSVVLSGALATKLAGTKKAGILAAFLIVFAGTLFFAVKSIDSRFESPAQVYSYASSTRLYTPSYIINEIPSYSFTVGDLHAHLLALPFFIFNLLLMYAFAKNGLTSRLGLLLVFGLASSGMINVWDLVTLSCLLLVIALARYYIHRKSWVQREAMIKTVMDLLRSMAVLAGAGLLMLPYLLHFQSPTMGLGFIPKYVELYNLKDVQWPTPWSAELGIWGVLVLGIFASLFAKRRVWKDHLFPLTLAFVGLGIVAGVELFFVREIYSVANPPFFRANTTFKFGYHAWVLFSIAFASLVMPVWPKGSTKYDWGSKLRMAIVVLAVIGGSIYPYQAIKQFYTNTGKDLTLDGSNWMQSVYPDDRLAINYINDNLKDRVVIAEAVGDSYTIYSRIATYTGMIAPMGWTTHEWTWRFDGVEGKKAAPGKQIETGWGKVAQVKSDIEQLYTSPDPIAARQLLEKYDIHYVYIGELERLAYPGLVQAKFDQLGTIIWQRGTSNLYQIKLSRN